MNIKRKRRRFGKGVEESDSDYFKKLFRHLPGWTEDNHEDRQPE
jgi:hypothetical protein